MYMQATESAFQTLFVGRLAYETTERKLRREFEQYGPIRQVVLVSQQTRVPGASKPRGYAFIEFEKEDDVKEAYKRADGKKIDDRRIVVDVERGRFVVCIYKLMVIMMLTMLTMLPRCIQDGARLVTSTARRRSWRPQRQARGPRRRALHQQQRQQRHVCP